ncbi:putative ankyrin repeat protein [Smittium mucronatum]|uniref:Putative ankyrin repeat protein n=1 Tax=Smittium mucronatum TaxID=133383 RepID=A0A1R0GWZ5_9FUNG|nr:putative ankyrin repeat protein [Smittium mucronatum]
MKSLPICRSKSNLEISKCSFESFPFEILERIFIYAQNPNLSFISPNFYVASKSAHVRAHYLALGFLPDQIFDSRIGIFRRYPRLLSTNFSKQQLIIIKLLDLGANPVVCEQHLFNLSCSKGWLKVISKLLLSYKITKDKAFGVDWSKIISFFSQTSDFSDQLSYQRYYQDRLEDHNIEFRSFSVSTALNFGDLVNVALKQVIVKFLKYNNLVKPLIDINSSDGIALVQAIGSKDVESVKSLLDASKIDIYFLMRLDSTVVSAISDYIDKISAIPSYSTQSSSLNFYHSVEENAKSDEISSLIGNNSQLYSLLKHRLLNLVNSDLLVAVNIHSQLDINCSNGYPLTLAAELNLPEIVSLLLKNKADPKIDNSIALRSSVLRGDINYDITKQLVDAGADIHCNAESCLLSACYRGDFNPTCMETCAKSDNCFNRNGSVYGGVQNLYQTRYSKIDISMNNRRRSPYQNGHQSASGYYSGHTHLKTIKLLLDSGADYTAKNNLSLVYAVTKGHYFTLQMLLQRGPDLTVPSNDPEVKCSEALLTLAKKSGRQDIVQLIMEYVQRQ